MERFRVLWRRGDFAAAYGKRLPELLAEWRAALGAVPITPGGLRRAERLYRASGIFQQPCAHELARLEVRAAMAAAAGDFGEAERLETRLAELDPENPERRLALAGIRLRRQDWSGARMAARAMLAENRAGPAAQERAWRLMGDVAWRLNDLSAADSSYAHAVALAGSSADRRAYEVRRATLRDPHLALLLRDYLTGPGGEPSQDLATIYRARAAAPESALPHYLLGRRLVQEGLPEDGAPELRSALDAGGLGPEATVAALELLGRAELAAGRPRAALEALDRLLAPSQDEVRLGPGLSPPTVPLSHGRALGIADWISRARWALGQASAAYDSTAGASGNR
jgi:Flp pilus assembly protein TadD